jgi:hypothetical protein
VVRAGGRALAVRGDGLRDLAARLEAAPDGAPFQLLHEDPVVIEAGAGTRVEIAADGAFRDGSWNAFAAAARPRDVLAWLADAGIPGPLGRFDEAQGPGGVAARAAWIAAAPEAVRAFAEAPPERPLDGAAAAAATRTLEKAAGGVLGKLWGQRGRGAAIVALLRWYGHGAAPLAARPAYEELPRILLSPYGFQEVLDTFASLRDDAERRGAARFLLAGPVSPSLLEQVGRTPLRAREAIAAALAAVDAPAAARLRRRLFPEVWRAPAGTTLLAVSSAAALRRAVTDGAEVYAVDGFDLVRLTPGAREVLGPMAQPWPMAGLEGAVLVQRGGTVRRYVAGAIVETYPAAQPDQQAAAQQLTATWSSGAPPEPGAVAVAPTDEERAAFQAFAHTGAPPPFSAAWVGRAFLLPAAVLRAGPGGGWDRLELPGEIGVHAVGSRGLAVTVHEGEATRVAWIGESGEPLVSAPLPVERADVLQILAGARGAYLRLAAAPGEAVVAVPRP